jgi:hypothetical protein
MKPMASCSLIVMVFSLAATGCGSQEKVCAPDQRICSNACVSLQSDAQNCGACGNVCGAGKGCSAGACVDCASTPGACATAVVAACFNLNQVRPLAADLTASAPPLATDVGPSVFARVDDASASAPHRLFVTNDLSASISELRLDLSASTIGGAAYTVPSGNVGFSDLPFIAAKGKYLLASNAAANSVVVLDTSISATSSEPTPVRGELPLPGPFGNPQGVDFVGSKAYVALNGKDAVAVLDVSQLPALSLLKTIDLSNLAPPGASAMPSRVIAAGGRIYVTLWGLDPVTFAPPVGGHGRLAVIDPAIDEARPDPIDLGASCLNPAGMTLSGSSIWIACGFHAFNSAQVSGGALVQVDTLLAPPAPVATIALATHAAGSVAICNGRGYAGATESGRMISFDPGTRALIGDEVVCPAEVGKGSFVSDVTCAP